MILFLLTSILCSDNPRPLPDDVVHNIQERVEYGEFPSISIAIVALEGRSYFGFGDRGDGKAPSQRTVYEIGSISKVFTSVLLAQAVVDGKLELVDPIQNLLPENIHAPTRDGIQIGLAHLATHTSGLPRLPSNLHPADPGNPYADYSETQLFAFLETVELDRPIGSELVYSNYGVGLLGHLLARRTGLSYDDLMQRTIADPLDMDMTACSLTADMRANLAPPTASGNKVSNWDLTTLAGAGGIRSNAEDMASFIAANMGLMETQLRAALDMTHKEMFSSPDGTRIGLGWFIRSGDTDIIWHNGGTGGYRSFAGFLADGGLGVVVLCNSTAGVDDIGFHLLDESLPLKQPNKSVENEMTKIIEGQGVEAALKTYRQWRQDAKSRFEFKESDLNNLGYAYLGKGNIDAALEIFKLNVETFPDSFNPYDSLGEAYLAMGDKANAITNYSKSLQLNPGNDNARNALAKLGQQLPSPVMVPAETLDQYAGVYQIFPGFQITITAREDHLFAQATGQPEFEVFAKTQTLFYFKVVNAQLEFHRDAAGQVTAMTLHQNGSHRGLRVEP